MSQICANIKQAREAAGISQVEMSKMLGLSRTTYANWETETEPNVATLKRIAQILGIEFSQLVNEKIVEDKLSDMALRFLTMLEKEQNNVKDAHDIIRILAGKVKSDINDPPKEGSPSLKTMQNVK
jgi:transcriptional regulator with XRE-family HTH domain